MKKKIMLFIGIFLIFFIGNVLAITCSDVFYTTGSDYPVCGYCYGGGCSCNFTIFYNNGTNIIINSTSIDLGDNSYVYYLNNSYPPGYYVGSMYCGVTSYSEFSFQIIDPTADIVNGCTDTFYTTGNNYPICGYCIEANSSPCLISRECNFSIYYQNGTNLIDGSSVNLGDGSIIYYLNNATPLGNYFGLMDCGITSYSEFSFQILPLQTSNSGGGGGGGSLDIRVAKCYYISSEIDSSTLGCMARYSIYECKNSDYTTQELCMDELKRLQELPVFFRAIKLNLSYIGKAIYPPNGTYGLIGFIILISLIVYGIKYFRKKRIKSR